MVIAGLDEAGRGPLAGPLVCAAVILRNNAVIPGLTDSKLLTFDQRQSLFPEIIKQGIASVSVISVPILDKKGLLRSLQLGFSQAAEGLTIQPDELWIDGKDRFAFKIPHKTIIRGDSTVPAISAASIVAKVVRDALMVHIAKKYPQYHFDIHKGYGTELHFEMIRQHGISPAHRRFFAPIFHELYVQKLPF